MAAFMFVGFSIVLQFLDVLFNVIVDAGYFINMMSDIVGWFISMVSDTVVGWFISMVSVWVSV